MTFTQEGMELIRACEEFIALARNNCATEADCNMATFYARQVQAQLLVRKKALKTGARLKLSLRTDCRLTLPHL